MSHETGLTTLIDGAHFVIDSKDAEADRAFFRDILGLPSVDDGCGWLIFALAQAEAAFHPAGDSLHELYLMCDDLTAEIAPLASKGFACSEIQEARWGSMTKLRLPDGGQIGLYQPRHPTAFRLSSK